MSFNHSFHFNKAMKLFAQKGLSILSIIGLLLGALPAAPAQTAASILYASPHGKTSGGCDSWANACELSYGLKFASPGSEIWVKAGSYLPGSSPNEAFVLKNGVALYGGFLGVETARDQANWYTHPTTLSGDIAGNDLPDFTGMDENSRHVVIAKDVDSTAVLNGFFIRSGSANGTGADGLGGAVQVYNASPTLKNLVLTHNYAARGGGIGCYGDSTLTLTNTQYEKNLAMVGGGLNSENGCVTAQIGAVFSANRAATGAAIYNNSATMMVANASISGNTASTAGGGIANSNSTMLLGNTILWNNHLNQGLSQIINLGGSYLATFSNIIQGGFDGTDNRDVDPRFAENPTSGADQTWGTADDTPGNLMLRYDSPAIDSGNKQLIPDPQMRDLRNWPRIIDHPRPDTPVGPLVDLGGYEAGIIFIRQGATGRQDGSSWKDAFTDLRSAMAITHASDEVWASAGTYTVGTDRSATLLLKNDVAVYGGFAGTETFRAERNWMSHVSLLSGLTAPGGIKAYHVVSAINVGPSAVLDGFTIRDGNANSTQAPDNQGGGIYLNNASPTLTNLTITQNAAAFGGGLYLNSANIVMSHLVFQENIATGVQGEGGGIYSVNASYSLVDSTFLRNTAVNGGGIANAGASAPRLINLYFLGNTAENGGGIYNVNGASPDISNAVFVGNQASYGGGIYNLNLSAPIVRNATIVSNPGGAFYADTNAVDKEPMLVNIIAWDNTGSPFVTQNSFPSINYSLIEGGCPKQLTETCFNILSSDPLFYQMPSRGPDNLWGTADDHYGDLRLSTGSKAIDAGTNSGVASGVTTDIAGRRRFLDDPGTPDSGVGPAPIVDMGAYENRVAPSTSEIISVTPATSYAGQEVLVKFQVKGNLGAATGDVQITDGVESCTAAASLGECRLTLRTPGQKTLAAQFLGDEIYDPSVSAAFVYTVKPIPTKVDLSLDPPGLTGAGQTVRASFGVSPAITTAYLPDGIVTVSSEGGSCSAPLIEGGCNLVFANPGTYHVTAAYQGNTFFAPQNSATLTYEVQALRATKISLTISPSLPTHSGDAVRADFAVTITDPQGGTATGIVEVTDGKHSCQAALVDGKGTCNLVLTGVGKHTLIASYPGQGIYGRSTSAPVIHDVWEILYFPIISR